jgi:nucleotide-binding universal stress UspA family protein
MTTEEQTRSYASRETKRTAVRVLCGIDASRADEAAVDGACLLAGPHGHVSLVCVVHSTGAGYNAQATIEPDRARAALERAMKQARDQGVRASIHLVHNADAAGTLMRAAANGDALAVGTHDHTRAGGFAIGSVATTALHKAEVPVLVARASTGRSIVVASDGSPGSDRACDLAARIAGTSGLALTLLTVDRDGVEAAHRHALARQTVELAEATGEEPTVVSARGGTADAIVNAVTASGCSLLVVGSDGHSGVRALGSVSERVAHRAPCSVLVARPDGS